MENGLARGVNIGTDIGIYDGDQTGIIDGLANGVYNENRLYLENLNLPIIRDGLVLHLDAGNVYSYSGSGTGITWRDISGSGNNGRLINGPVFNSGNGGFIDFDGTNDYVECSVIDNTQELTLAGWFLHPASTFESFNALVAKDAGTTFNRIYQIALEDGKLQQHLSPGRITTATSIATNRWIYYTYTSTATGNTSTLYQNAVSVGTGTAIAANTGNIPIRLHAYNGTGVTGTIRIATTKIYNRALSAAEVLQNYNATKARFGL
jgi:hypothetical protein